MAVVNRLFTVALGLFLISAGIAKFTTGHVFQYIEFKSGIDLFYPFINNLTGIAEVFAGAAILFRPSRLLGAVVAFGLMAGAIGFHLSPWLGISVPTGLVDGATSPWEGADFAASMSATSFVLAIVSAIRAAAIVRVEWRDRTSDANRDVSVDRGDAIVSA